MVLLGVWGCSREPAIRQYTIPKESHVASASGPTEPREILAAIVPKTEDAWFFKLMGEPAKIQEYKQEFRQLVNSVSFADNGKPQWRLPEKWREEGGGEFVYASLRPPGEDSLKITVSPLAMPSNPAQLDEAAWRDYVVRNINRWRGQLQLPEQSWDEIARVLEPIENLSLAKAPAYFVTLRGSTEASAADGASGMPSANASTPAPALPSSTGRSAKKDLQFDLPPGWREVPPLSIIALKSFEADGPEGTKATITLTSAGGDTVSNVARWNSQVKGNPDQASKALDASEKLTVNGAAAEVVYLAGPEPDGQAIMAAMIHWDPQSTLFVKLTGPASAVQSQRDAFMSLTKSLKW